MTTHFKPSGVQRGDITGWAKATSSFLRPDNMVIRRRQVQRAKVKNLGAIVNFHAQPAAAVVAPRHQADSMFFVP